MKNLGVLSNESQLNNPSVSELNPVGIYIISESASHSGLLDNIYSGIVLSVFVRDATYEKQTHDDIVQVIFIAYSKHNIVSNKIQMRTRVNSVWGPLTEV